MRYETDGGGGGSAVGSVPWPPLDMASLWEAGASLGTQAKVVSQAAGTLASARGGVSSWAGPAASAWHATASASLAGLDEVSERLGSAARILDALFETIENLQTQYQEAVGQELAARQQLAPPSHQGEPSPVQTVGTLAWMATEEQRLDAIRAEQLAVDNVHGAAHAAAGRLFGLGDGLPAPVRIGRVGAPPGPSGTFITMLFGSLVGTNRISGLQFQEEVLQLLGLKENMSNYKGLVGPKGFRPDSIGGDDDDLPVVVVEVKNAMSVSRITQILNEVALAESEGTPFMLVVNGATSLTRPLLAALAEAATLQGSPAWVRYWGGGRATDGDSGEPVEADPTTHTFTPSRSQPGDPPPETDQPQPTSPGGGDGGDGGEGGDPDPLGGDPIEPFLP